ncbi:hypothetical protein [Winogradskyella sp. UBA3174]|uniref:hypothetical protein n=1 Tax=Winogradskyella sp. UBA3174 TaxID=1947785 RepID=UPI0025D2A234|nr:hypothetical protein [Winogradskyella sp. UBA3174]|tara:strand:+ start:62684 stop:63154 length:471 start_codon:yes stop_codon:yes gene_type:complete
MTKTILFRADGNSDIGLGHLYRLFSLVEIIIDSYDFVFLTRETSEHSIIPSNYRKVCILKDLEIENEPQWLVNKYSPEEHIIIADGYQFISSYQKLIKGYGFKLIYIDDLAKEYMYADVVINHSAGLEITDYKKKRYATSIRYSVCFIKTIIFRYR